jgi:hypothetical protein
MRAVTGSGGRLHFGMVAGIKSERWPTSNRNPWPDCVGIRNLVKVTVRITQEVGFVPTPEDAGGRHVVRPPRWNPVPLSLISQEFEMRSRELWDHGHD